MILDVRWWIILFYLLLTQDVSANWHISDKNIFCFAETHLDSGQKLKCSLNRISGIVLQKEMYKTVRLFHFYLTLQPWKICPLRILQCGEKLCYINLLTITKTGIFLFIYPRDSVETYHLNKATAKTFFDKGYFKISSAVSRLRPLSTSDEDQTTVTVITPPATVACRWHKQYNHISSTEGEVIWLIRAEIQEEKKKKASSEEAIYHHANYWNNKTALSFAFSGLRTGAFHPSYVKYSAVLLVSDRGGSSELKVKPQTTAGGAIIDPLLLIFSRDIVVISVHFEEECRPHRRLYCFTQPVWFLIQSDPNKRL